MDIKLKANTKPFLFFIQAFESVLKSSKRFFNLSPLPDKLVRFEIDDNSATTGEMIVTFYPSDSFYRFYRQFLTENRDSD